MIRRRYITEPSDIIVDARKSVNDAEIIRILTADGRCKHSTYLTKRNANKITSPSGFKGNTIIEDMSWFKYSSVVKLYTDGSFNGCTSLRTILIPKTFRDFGLYALQNCKSLESIDIPYGVTTIGQSSFAGCSSLKEFKIPRSVTTFGGYCLQNTTSLEELFLPNSITGSLVRDQLRGSGIKRFIIEDNFPQTDLSGFGGLFYGCKNLEHVYVPEGVEYISAGFLSNTNTLKSIVLPSTLKDIKEHCFYGGAIGKDTVFRIPQNVKSIGNKAFDSSYLDQNIPEGVESLGLYSLSNCKIDYVVIPKSLTTYLGDTQTESTTQFSGSRKSIIVKDGNPVYHSIDNCMIETATNRLVLGCLDSIIPEGVVEIANAAFSRQGWKRMDRFILPSTIQKIGKYAIYLIDIDKLVIKAVTPPEVVDRSSFNYANKIYVPDESVEAYKVANVFSEWANRIYPISQLPE